MCAFGATITVPALAIEPFTQQVVRPAICHKLQPGLVAEVPRANNCTELGYHNGPAVTALDPGMSATMYAGLLNNSQVVDVRCSTGNCTFLTVLGTAESYQTFGFSSKCVDITTELKELGSREQTWTIPALGNQSEITTVFEGNSTRTLITGDQYQRGQYDSDTFGRYWPPEQGINALLQVVALTISVDWPCFNVRHQPDPDYGGQCMKQIAAECKLWPAVHFIQARVDLGKLYENLIADTPLHFNYGITSSH